MGQKPCYHGCCCGLAMAAGNCNAEFIETHQFCQHFCPGDNRNIRIDGMLYLRVSTVDGRGYDNDISPFDPGTIVPDMDDAAKGFKAAGYICFLQV